MPAINLKTKIDKISITTAKSVEKHTGRDWNEWGELLNKQHAHNWTYQEISAYLAKKHKLSIFWRNIVANGYEVMIGRRLEGRSLKGDYSVTVVKTIYLDGSKLWKFMMSPAGVAIWLKPLSEVKIKPKVQFESEGGIFGEIRTMKAPERIRMTWQDTDWLKPTVVQILVIGRVKGKAMLVIQHEKLIDGRLKNQIRESWKQVCEDLKSAVLVK